MLQRCGHACLILCNPMDCSPPGASVPWDYPGKNTGVGCHALLQGIFLTWGSNLCFLHWRADSLSLSHLGSPERTFGQPNTRPVSLNYLGPIPYTRMRATDCDIPLDAVEGRAGHLLGGHPGIVTLNPALNQPQSRSLDSFHTEHLLCA